MLEHQFIPDAIASPCQNLELLHLLLLRYSVFKLILSLFLSPYYEVTE
jgi:hypothetical protein